MKEKKDNQAKETDFGHNFFYLTVYLFYQELLKNYLSSLHHFNDS